MKMLKWNISRSSISFKLILGIILILLPLIGFLIYNVFYSINIVHNQVSQSYKNTVTFYMQQLDNNMRNTELYLANLAGSNGDVIIMESSQQNDERALAKSRVFLKMSSDVAMYDVDEMFIFSDATKDFMEVNNTNNNAYIENFGFEDYVKNMLENQANADDYSRHWFYIRYLNQYYFVYIFQSDNVYFGAWINAGKILSQLKPLDAKQRSTMLFISDNGTPLEKAAFISANKIKLDVGKNSYRISGTKQKYLVVGQESSCGDYSLEGLIPDDEILQNLPYLRIAATAISIASLLLIPIAILFLRKSLLKPLSNITTAMKYVQSGDFEYRIGEGRTSDEFKIVNNTFNQMSSQIKMLKINIYEEQINKQKAELNRLHLQINPHFFLNSLNIIYSLAETKNYKLIQEMTLCLVKYFRYIAKSNMELVVLKDELQHIENYLHIQKLRHPDGTNYALHVQENLTNAKIPPLLIQTFIENSIKYAVSLDHPLFISVEIGSDTAKPDTHMQIIIRDNGDGFPETVLEQLNSGRQVVYSEKEHIGIWNAQQRLNLTYGNNSTLRFSNSTAPSGAVTTISLPVEY